MALHTSSSHPSFTFEKLIKYFLKLGSIGFGGPLALVGYMRTDLTEKYAWMKREDFLNGLALSSLCPGPIATQLAIYIGWFYGRILGATLAFFAFTLPAFSMILTLAIAYTHYGDVAWVHAAFYGVSACVISIVIRHAYKLSKMIVAKEYWLWGVFILNIILSLATSLPMYWALLLSGVFVLSIKSFPRSLFLSSIILPTWLNIESLSQNHLLGKVFLYFAWAGTVVFGSGYAIIPFIHEGVVQNYHWLTEQQFLDAIGVGMITPGPMVLSVAFIGYLIAGFKGALAATAGVFLPCYLCVILLAPHFHRIAHHKAIHAFVQGLTISVAGTITGTTLLLGKKAIVDFPTIGIFVVTFCGLFALKKVPEPLWIFLAAGIGILVK